MDSDPPLSGSGWSRLRRTALFLGAGRLDPPFCVQVLWVYSGTPSVSGCTFNLLRCVREGLHL